MPSCSRTRIPTASGRGARTSRPDADPDEPGQPWTATTWSLNSLREWGLDAAVLAGTAEKLAANSRWEYDNLPYWGGEVDCCINGYTLANGAWLGADVSGLADWFVEHRMPDGGWNCEWVEGSTRSSFHSTLNSLKGILSYEMATGGTAQTHGGSPRRRGVPARAPPDEPRLSTGEQVDHWVNRFAYPFRWYYSVLKATDYFRSASLHDGVAPDARLADAIEAVRGARQPDGTWLQERRHPGRVWFEVDAAPERAVAMAHLLRHSGARVVGRGPLDLDRAAVLAEVTSQGHRRIGRLLGEKAGEVELGAQALADRIRSACAVSVATICAAAPGPRRLARTRRRSRRRRRRPRGRRRPPARHRGTRCASARPAGGTRRGPAE